MGKSENDSLPKVVILGGGFGGLEAAKALAKVKVNVTVVDRTNHHVFQPLLYQVATAGLSPADIAAPIRAILSSQKNLSVLLDEVTNIDVEKKIVYLRTQSLPFDYLIAATGMTNNYFGHDEWAKYSLGLKSLQEAVKIRHQALVAYEEAERESNPERQKSLMTFVVIGGGATGVEVAGSFAELAKFALARDFRKINPTIAKVILVEGGERLLTAFPEELSASAKEKLEKMGVEVKLNTRVTNIDATGVTLGNERVESHTVVWAAGVKANPVAHMLGGECDKMGRVKVNSDCSVAQHSNVFAIGDMMNLAGEDGQPLPGVAQVALQQGRFVVDIIKAKIAGKEPKNTSFKYNDLGSMATIGRSAAVAKIGGMKLTGMIAWLGWLFVHLISLIGFRNRLSVLFNWFWSYLTYQRGARLIVDYDPLHLPGSVRVPPSLGSGRVPSPLIQDSSENDSLAQSKSA